MNGAVALTILDDAADVFLRISYKESKLPNFLYPLSIFPILQTGKDDILLWIQNRLTFPAQPDPIAQSDFVSLSADIESLDAGHQCYNHFTIPRDVEAGDVATLQLEYRAEDDGKIVSHYACADIVSSLL